MKNRYYVCIICLLVAMSSVAQEKFELFKYGDMDSWVTRRIEESSIIGGNVKYLYELGPEMDLTEIFHIKSGWFAMGKF